ncbi:MAG: sigma 54-interacting transcriptional regulator, partial [Clostridiales Family XIII bacterium]|jgi:transcriptional regulator with PAS, ATPase and Fis domain|nr:sigma 54-interacting transcriptional regulator [Clostridiales Family XIII bacterium]
MIARYIHNTGAHAEKPFVHVNCAALPANLIDSELFGHTKGAFTGAAKEKKGKFEAAEGGTIFLDEISTLSLDLQAKLLHVLQERSYEKIGSNIPQKLKCRVITATNSNLAEDVQAGKFRKDLYYRLNVVNIHCPPLRQRKEDIELLMSHFFDRYNRQYHRAVSISLPYTWELILAYNWPGNVRELENFIERIVAMNISDEKNIQDILLSFGNFNEHNMDADPSSESAQVHDIADLLRNQEYRIIINALNKNNGHRERTAQELGISRRTLQYKLKKYNINKPLPEV